MGHPAVSTAGVLLGCCLPWELHGGYNGGMALSGFHPTVRAWFERRFGEATEPQREGWPAIREGRHVLIAAPTGTGKTLAAFLWAIDGLVRQCSAGEGNSRLNAGQKPPPPDPLLGKEGGSAVGDKLRRYMGRQAVGDEPRRYIENARIPACRGLPDETQVLYVSPLRALSNDVQKNLSGPLREMAEIDPAVAAIRVLVRTGDTPPRERTAMAARPPHILVTTPESLYILLTSAGGRRMLRTVRTVIVDEIHSIARDKRGSHLALSLERLEALVGKNERGESALAPASASEPPAGRLSRISAVPPALPTNVHTPPTVETVGYCRGVPPGTPNTCASGTDAPADKALAGPGASGPVAHESKPSAPGYTPGEPSSIGRNENSPAFQGGEGGLLGPVAPMLQRIGLSATQKPLSEVGKFLVGVDRECKLVDVGHRREMDVAVEVPPSPLSTVCSHEQWDEIYTRIAELIEQHRTTLVFVNTRKLAERVAARLTDVLGEDHVTCHHSSLSRERRLDAEQRLKAGKLRALVATASLELGIDIGEVDLVIQVGGTRSISTFLQRVGRSGHAVRRTPKGRIFPLTIDELVESAALLRVANRGELDRTPQPSAPLDILAQQMVAECVGAGDEGRGEDDLFALFTRAWPYRGLTRDAFDTVAAMHTEGRRGLLHRDGVGRRLLARKRARITAVTSGGAIPDIFDFQVLQEPEGLFVGTLNEDFAIESNVGDVFQLGNTSWRILKVERGAVRVADAKGQPPSIPFWLGEGPSRTPELSQEIGRTREDAGDAAVLQREIGLSAEAATQIAEYLAEGRSALGTVPTQSRLVLERFFDESGGMQLVLHAPFGGRINRAWGLALRKRFCRGFGFELQAAANEEAIVISLGLQHSFPLEDVFNYLHPDSVEEVLTQAVLDQPMFESRWRWNATRSLVLDRFQNGKRVPPAVLRMRAADLLAATFPAAVACPENMPAGDLPIPMDHPLVRQTIEDCLSEATDVAGLIEVLKRLRAGEIEKVAVDVPTPSAFARGILNSQPYSFLDDAPLEERRTQAVINRRALDQRSLDQIGALDPAAVARVREEAWPQPESAEEVHEALTWMGFVTDDEAQPWGVWLVQLASAGRVIHQDGRWLAVDRPREAKKVLLGRLEALGPVAEDDPRIALHAESTGEPSNESESGTAQTLLALEREGSILRTRLDGRTYWCERRLLARMQRYTLERLRQEIEPVSAAEFLQFLACWQHVDEKHRLEGPRGAAEVLRQLAGFEAPAREWEHAILPARVSDYRREWLDELTLSGEFAWGRLWGGGGSAIRVTPIAFVAREEMDSWLGLTEAPTEEGLSGAAKDLLDVLSKRGAMFPQELQKAAGLPPAFVETGLADLVAHGMVTCDSFAALRQLLTPPSKRRRPVKPVGRWSRFRTEPAEKPEAEFAAMQLLRRTGVVFRKTLTRERIPVSWSALVRVYRRMELRGDVRGGRFVAGFSGEQYALPEAVEMLRRVRREGRRSEATVSSADPLNFSGILTPDERVSSATRTQVRVG